MSGMTKAQQWRIAATVINLVREATPQVSETRLRMAATDALICIRPTAPWEYPWSEVVDSLRDRSAAALVKRGKSA